jgi:glycosyltransferase involved in cell wall biosynthesis
MTLEHDDILVLTAGFWNTTQRMRHKMPIAWAKAGNRVLWIEQSPFPGTDWHVSNRLKNALAGNLREVETRLWVGSTPPAIPYMFKGGSLGNSLRRLHRPFYVQRIKHYLKQLNFKPKLVVLLQLAARHDILKFFPAPCTIYYSHDLYGYGHVNVPALEELKKCCRAVDMVWTTSEMQRKQLAAYSSNAHHFPHAVDIDWWKNNHRIVPEEYASIKPPRAVYTGVFHEKIDLPLLVDVATKKPEWNLVFVGPVSEQKLNAEILKKARSLPNMHFLEEKKPAQLAGYIAGADLLMLPYVADETRRFAGLALKFYEYMISGKPIISTPYTELETDAKDLLSISAKTDDWISFFDSCLKNRDLEKEKQRVALAHKNSYKTRLETQRGILKDWVTLNNV